jgi:sulfur transfer protein SufE
VLEARPRRPALQDQQLLPEAKITGDQQHLWLESRSNSPQQTAKHTPFSLLSDGKKSMVNVVNEMPSGLQPGFRHRAHVS